MEKQPNSLYIRLHSDFKTNRSIYSNSVSDFENSLNSARDLEGYNIGIADLHITGTLDKNGLREPQDWAIIITETLPTFSEIDFRYFEKWVTHRDITRTHYRNKHITDDWAFVSNEKYTTRVTTSYSERQLPVKLRTDMFIRTDLTDTEFLEEVAKIKDEEIEIEETDEEIIELLESELLNLVKGEEQTSYKVFNMINTLDNSDYEELLQQRVLEWKENKKQEKRLKALQLEIEKYPPAQSDVSIQNINLEIFLNHVEATLNCHPLYAFSKWEITPSSSRNKNNVTLKSNRGYDAPGTITFTFGEKVKQILQINANTIDPVKGLMKADLDKNITFDYPATFPAFLETTLVTHSLLGPDIRRVLKTIQIQKEKSDKINYTKYYSNIEYHPCERYTAISAIRMRMVDKYGSTVQFKSGELTATLH